MRLFLISILFFLTGMNLWSQNFLKNEIAGGNLISPTTNLVADINGDGFQDIVTSNETNSSLIWYRNINGNLGFDEGRLVGNMITQAAHLIAIDVDNDGDMDIVAAAKQSGNNGNALYWFENLTGTGVFAEGVIFSDLVDNPQFLDAGDLDGDGDVDIVSASNDDDKIAWYENENGLGSFGVQIVLTSNANGAQKARLVDLDEDGDLDIVFCSVNDGKVAWIENTDGAGNFSSVKIIDILPQVTEVSVGDINGDNQIDIVAATNVGNEIVWYANEGNADSFGNPQQVNPYLDSYELALRDMDGDNDLDVLVSSYIVLDEIAWFENMDGQGSFNQEKNIVIESGIRYFTATDIDDDEDIDFVFPFESNNRLMMAENSGNGLSFIYKTIDFGIENYIAATIGDLDSDGLLDIVSRGSQMIVHKNTGNYTERFTNQIISNAQFGTTDLVDVNADDKLDIVYHSGAGRSWCENNGMPSVFTDCFGLGGGDSEFDLADFDGDGDADVVGMIVNINGTNVIPNAYWMENPGDGSSFINHYIAESGYSFLPKTGDIDGDGDMDFVFTIYLIGGMNEIYWVENLDGLGNFDIPQLIFAEEGGSSLIDIELFDLTNDGRLEVMIADRGKNKLYWFRNNFGTTPWIGPNVITEDLVASLPVINAVDMDADGDLDIVINDRNEDISWFENLNAFSDFGEKQLLVTIEEVTTTLDIGDLDNDGDIDLVTATIDGVVGNKIFWFENIESNPQILVNTFFDENENGVKDPAEVNLNNQSVTLNPEGLVALNGDNGAYLFKVNTDTFQVECQAGIGWELTTPDAVEIIINTQNLDSVNFGLTIDTLISLPFSNLTSAITRCGFTVPFWLSTSNLGTQYNSGITALELDPLTTFVTAEPAPDSISGNQYFWFFDSLFPTYSHQIYLELEMPSVDFLGEFINLTSSSIFLDDNGNVLANDSYQFSSQINCAYDPNDKLVEPNIPNDDNYTLFGDTLLYTVRFQNTGTDTAINVYIEDYLNQHLDWSTLRVIASSHPQETTLEENGKVTFNFENIYLPDSTTNEQASHGFVKYEILPLDDLDENTLIHNVADIFFDFNEAILTNAVQNVLVSEYPITLATQSPSCENVANGMISVVDFPLTEGVNYEWNTGAMGLVIDNLSVGIYTLNVYDADNQIIADTSITLSALPITQTSLTETICEGDIVQIGNQVFDTTGVYEVVLSDSNGCDSMLILTLETLPQSDSLLSFTICEGEAIQIGDEVYTEAGTYTNLFQNELGCDSTFVLELAVVPVIELADTLLFNDTGSGNGSILPTITGGLPPYQYNWSNGATTANIEDLSTGTYELTVTDDMGCELVVAFFVDELNAVVDNSVVQQFVIAPNPSDGHFEITVQLATTDDWTVAIHRINGQLVRTFDTQQEKTLQVKNLENGVYIVNMLIDGVVVRREKVVVQ